MADDWQGCWARARADTKQVLSKWQFVAGIPIGAGSGVALSFGQSSPWALVVMAMVGAAIGPMLVYPAIYAVKLIRAPLRQRDEARQQIDNQFRPKIMLPSAKRKLYEDFIKRGEALLDELTEPDANQRLDDVYTRIALWETAVSARLRPLQLRGAMSSELDMMGAGVDSISLKEYVETRLRNLWHAQEPHRMPATHYPQPALPRLTEPRRAVGVSGTDSVYVGSDDRTE